MFHFSGKTEQTCVLIRYLSKSQDTFEARNRFQTSLEFLFWNFNQNANEGVVPRAARFDFVLIVWIQTQRSPSDLPDSVGFGERV